MADLRRWLDGLVGDRVPGRGVRAVLDAAVTDPELCAYASTHAVARAAGVNPATVVRAAQAVGFGGWPEFATELRSRYLSSLAVDRIYDLYADDRYADDPDGPGRVDPGPAGADEPARSAPPGTGDDVVRRVVGHDLHLLHTMLASTDPAAVHRAAEAVRTARRTVVFATGTYAAPGIQLAHVAQMLGHDVTVQNGAATAMLNSARLLGEGDCLFTFSLWRTSVTVRQAAEVARRAGATVVAVVDRRSAVAELADVVVTVPSEGRGFVPSIVCAVSVTQTILRLLADADPVTTRARLAELDGLWGSLGIVEDD
ncbi:MurR/RpiR family transcriptional regulator [Pseudonocardia nematodicida]|uniref:MurR/RpiR family transcriptional regulator n=1 Tax=Pseudonocardia nematodicida TaxID=1206997 RepID=A0ABV1KJR1_9PSEU